MLKDIVLFKLDVNNWTLGIIKATCVEVSALTTLSCNQSSQSSSWVWLHLMKTLFTGSRLAKTTLQCQKHSTLGVAYGKENRR